MDGLGIIRDFIAHMEWADATVWAAVRKLGSSDEKLRDRLRHLHGTQHAFLMIWRNEPVEFREPHDIEQWAIDYYVRLAQFLATVDTQSLDRPVNMPWAARFAGRQPAATSLAETLLQITSHSTYHRGQVNARIRELGGEPPLVDYIAWLWLGRPAAQWLHPIA